MQKNNNDNPFMQKFKKILFFYLILHFGITAFSQNSVKFEHISLLEGLSQSSVNQIIRDEYGYVWFATLDGLNRYDGYSIEVFRNHPKKPHSIADNAITCLHESPDKEIWVGHKKGGISVYDKISRNFKHFKQNEKDTSVNANTLINNDITSICSDRYGNIWIATTRGLSRMKRQKTPSGKTKIIYTNFATFTQPHFIFSNEINKIKCLGDTLWIASNNGLSILNIKTLKTQKIDYNALSAQKIGLKVRDFIFEKNSKIWIATDNGLGHYSLKTKSLESFFTKTANFDFISPHISSNSINTLFLDQDSSLWIGTADGLNHFLPRKKHFEIYRASIFNPDGLNSSEILSLFIDSEGILWVGTSLGGVNKWNRPAKHFKTIRNIPFDLKSVASNRIRCFYETRDSAIWIGTVDKGLERWNRKTDDFEHFNIFSDLHIRAIVEDSLGQLWLGTNAQGLDLFNPKTRTVQNFNTRNSKLTHNSIWTLLIDSQNRLWVGTSGGGVCVADLNRFEREGRLIFKNYSPIEKDSFSLSGKEISCIIQDKDQNIWIGTRDNGLNKLAPNSQKFEHFKFLPDEIKNQEVDRIYWILEDSEDTVWVSTRGTLSKYSKKQNKFTHYNYFNYNIPNPVMMCLLEDSKKNIWISTNLGLSCFDKKTKKVQNYDVTDGLQSNEFMVGSALKTFDGQLMFGGQTGFNAFFPADIKDNEHEPHVLITSFLVFDKAFMLDTAVTEKKHIVLDYSENAFTFEFVGFEYVNPLRNKYKYRLKNYEKKWREAGTRRFASYTNIPAGIYAFEVLAANNDGFWCKTGKSVIVEILPPFWQRTWFILLVLSILGLIAYFLLHLRDVHRDKSELEQKVILRTKEINEKKEAIEKINSELNEKQIEILNKNEELKVQQEQIMEKNEELLQQQEEILAQRDALEHQRDISEERRQAMTDSITYAQRIQAAILPPTQSINQMVEDHFVLYKPRDVVSGDFYWAIKKSDKLIVVAADCTGHGVPGAFLSMLGISFLNEIVGKQKIVVAAEILGHLRKHLIEALHQTGDMYESKDGMDAALCVIDTQKMELQFAGAYNPLWLCRFDANNERQLIELKADRMPVGISDRQHIPFTNHLLKIKKDDLIYLFSDGYADQFGGPNYKKFKNNKFKELLLQIFNEPLEIQKITLDETHNNWRGEEEQIDDILVFGIKI